MSSGVFPSPTPVVGFVGVNLDQRNRWIRIEIIRQPLQLLPLPHTCGLATRVCRE